MNPDLYCHDLAAGHSTDFRYSLSGLPILQRQALAAVHAFYLETTRIPDECHDPGVAQAKLDWWREELERLFTGTPRHPISQALHPKLGLFNLPQEYFGEILDGVAMDLEYDAYPSFGELTLYLHRHGSIPASLAAEITGYQDRRATPRFAHEAGMLLQLFDCLCQVREHARQGHCYLPEDEMQRFGVGPADLLAAQTTDRVRQLFAFQAGRIGEYHRRATELLPTTDRLAQSYLLIRLELAMALLAEIATEDYRLLEQQTRLTPLRKLWLAWRWRYRERRYRQRAANR